VKSLRRLFREKIRRILSEEIGQTDFQTKKVVGSGTASGGLAPYRSMLSLSVSVKRFYAHALRFFYVYDRGDFVDATLRCH